MGALKKSGDILYLTYICVPNHIMLVIKVEGVVQRVGIDKAGEDTYQKKSQKILLIHLVPKHSACYYTLKMRFEKGKYHFSLLPLLMVTVGLAIYWNALWNPFQYDDGSSIINNPYIHNLRNIPYFFFDLRFSQLIDDAGATVHYRPLWSASFAVNYALGGLNPVGYHLVNLTFHVGSAYLLFLIVNAMGGGYFAALAAGMIFLVHPFNSEVVNYITARSSVMCAFFYLLAFYFWIKYRNLKVSATSFYIASLLAFLLAMLTKEIAITLPIILFMYDLYSSTPLEKREKRLSIEWKKSIPYLPFIPLISIPLIMVYPGSIRFTYERGFISHLYTGAGVITGYLRLFLLPIGLTIDHHIKIYQTFFTPGVFFPALFLLLYLGISLSILKFLKREWWWVSFFMLFFLITILPTTLAPLRAPLQENRGYLPFAGISAAGGILLRGVYNSSFPEGRKKAGTLAAIFLIILLVVYSAGTINRNKVWQDRFTLWADAVQKAPDSPRAHANLAYVYTLRGEEDMAMKEYLEALRLEPENGGLHNDVATFYYKRGRFKEAESHLKAAITLRPDYYLAYSNLGLLYEHQGRLDEAVPLYQKALLLRPDFTTARNRLERVLTTRKSAN